eukprot:2126490-Karenia_brevis.AAC.1
MSSEYILHVLPKWFSRSSENIFDLLPDTFSRSSDACSWESRTSGFKTHQSPYELGLDKIRSPAQVPGLLPQWVFGQCVLGDTASPYGWAMAMSDLQGVFPRAMSSYSHVLVWAWQQGTPWT